MVEVNSSVVNSPKAKRVEANLTDLKLYVMMFLAVNSIEARLKEAYSPEEATVAKAK